MTSVPHAIAEFLRLQEFRFIFGKVGEAILPLLDAIVAEASLKFVSTYREEAAVLIADGFARTRMTPAVALLAGGPPTAQSFAAMAQAYHDGSPVLLIASDVPADLLAKRDAVTRTWEQQGGFARITRFSARVPTPQSVIETLEQAYRSAVSARKGPAFCAIPADFMLGETPERVRRYDQFVSQAPPSGDPDSIRRACELLIAAQRPVILLGGGSVWSGATSEAMELAEFLFAPIVSSSGKSGVVPDDFPLSIGRLGCDKNRIAVQTVAEADVLIALGCSFNDRTTFGFSRNLLAPSARLIQVDIDAVQLGRHYPIEIGVVGDARAVLRQILSFLRGIGAEKWPSRVIQRIQKVWERRELWMNEWTRLARSSDVPIRRLRLLKDVVEEAGREAILFGELPWKYCLKGSSFPLIESDDFPITGSNLCFAIGAKLAFPARPVLAFMGDGQFVAALTDLATAVEHGIGVVVIVARNECYGQAKAAQARRYGGRHIGVDHPFPNFAEVARSLGAHGERVESPADIRGAVRRALDSPQPALVEVLVEDSPGGAYRPT
ncbi:MAG TPA: thiamine pyrophosphate-binding protein [Candidatus Acidoferrales bacterium]|nr:thiamine pyrophosphate-binding protein [Candidatus Acidoferrales bacterium]